jgi:acylphosphatase
MTYKFLISGKVQGVWYRKFVSENAKKEGFRGYVKNLPNGKVEAVANIENENELNKFVEILKKGSPYSEVEDIEVMQINDMDFSDFKRL